MKIRKELLLTFPTLILFVLVFLGFKKFYVWQQILDGFSSGSADVYLTNIVSHSARLLLMHPIVSFADQFSLDRDIVFSYVVVLIFLIVNVRIYSWLSFYYARRKARRATMATSLILLSLFLLMNGRVAFSFLGNALLFDAILLIYYKRKIFIPIVLALFAGLFCNVSSGTFAVMTINLSLHLIVIFLRKPFSNIAFKIFWIYTFAVGVYTPVLFAGIYKNLKYYNYSVKNMLSHGYGDFFLKYNYLLLILIPIGLLTFFTILNYLLSVNLNKLEHIRAIYFISAFFGGLFGYSSLLGALPILLFWMFTFNINRKTLSQYDYQVE